MEKKATDLSIYESFKENYRTTSAQLRDSASSILSLTRQWREIEEFIDSSQNHVQECFKELKSREEQLVLKEEMVEQRAKNLALVQDSIALQAKEIGRKEEEFCAKQKLDAEKRRSEVESIEKSSRELQLLRESTQRKLDELGSKHRDLILTEKSTNKRIGELKLMGKSVNGEVEDLRLKEKAFEKRSKDLEMKEKRFEESFKLKEKQVEALSEELRRKYDLLCENLESKFKECEKRSKLFEIQEEKYEQRLKTLRLKEKKFEEWSEQLELKDKRLQEWSEQLGLKEKAFEQRSQDLELKEKRFEERYLEWKAQEKSYEERYRDVQFNKECEELLEGLKKKYESQCEELELDFQQCEKRSERLQIQEEKCEQWLKGLKLKEDQLVEWSEQLKLKEKRLKELSEQLELKENGLDVAKSSHFHGKLEPAEDSDSHSDAVLRFFVVMDGKELQIFLNERCKEHHLIRDDIARALQFSSDPAELVLHAMEGFYPPHLRVGDMEFEGDVVKSSCILLLEQLRKLSPKINLRVRKVALKIAVDWLTKITTDAGHHLDVLGFLQLLASFGLADAFGDEELLDLYKKVPQHSQDAELFRVLGLANKTSDVTMEEDSPANPPLESGKTSSSLGLKQVPQDSNNSMDGEALRFLLQTPKNDNKMHTEITDALQSVTDPARLVLDTIYGFGPSKMEKNKGFSLCVTLQSCLSLLQQLRRISPEIKPQVKDEAMKYAFDWKQKLGKKREYLEVTCFLQFLATYGLATAFKPDELLDLLDNDYWRQKAPDLCEVLGLVEEIPKFIQKHIENGSVLEAVKYIYSFDMVHKFPPLPLLTNHLENLRRSTRNTCWKNRKSVNAKINTIKREISSVEEVRRLVEKYKLGSKILNDGLRNRNAFLLKELEKQSKLPTGLKKQPGQQSRNKRPRVDNHSFLSQCSVRPNYLQFPIPGNIHYYSTAMYHGFGN
ncbi:hypothetical protein SLEP1_g17514 [Rubroshorea leprosula]|uniref:FRIGIDA-like protein n=1 Tax=Rubroshorea leprosula TaxID=152421 RepID=A0AAV5J696_9ROSI|nr:hypothetical protein SLEP1_g17514 [Rubroshorea leprosula]